MSGASEVPDSVAPVVVRPVAFVRSRFTRVQGMPIQTVGAAAEEGVIELVPALTEALQITPFLDDREHGVFATRAPSDLRWGS